MANQITPNPSVPSQVVQEVKFPKFVNNLGIIPTSYKDSMSYYECLAWLCKFLEETVIPTVNENGEAVEELQNLYVELKNYVENYLDDYNFQEEVNNKLDELTESGYFDSLISDFLKLTRVYDTNVLMKEDSENLINGMKIKTLGYYEINDGGSSNYIISNSIPENQYYETIETGLYAILINENYVNAKQLGCKIKDENNFDNSTIINNFLQYNIPLYIPKGTWIMENIQVPAGAIIKGDFSFTTSANKGTILINKNANPIFILGTDGNPATSIKIEDICMTSPTNSVDCLMLFYYCYFSEFKNLFFHKVNGSAIKFVSAWELNFYNTNIRHCWNFQKYAITFADTTVGNKSAIFFDTINFECCIGGLIETTVNSVTADVYIDNIFYEEGTFTQDSNINQVAQNSMGNYTDIPLIKLMRGSSFVINNIISINQGNFYYLINTNQYQHKTMISIPSNPGDVGLNITNLKISTTKSGIKTQPLECKGTTTTSTVNKISIKNISARYGMDFDILSNFEIDVEHLENKLLKYRQPSALITNEQTLFNKISIKKGSGSTIFNNIPSYNGLIYKVLIYVPTGITANVSTIGNVSGVSARHSRASVVGDNAWHTVSWENDYDDNSIFSIGAYGGDDTVIYNDLIF